MSTRPTRCFIAFYLSLGVCPARTHAQELSVGDLLKKVEATYRQASSFNIVVEKSVELATVGESNVGGSTVRSNFHQSENIQVGLVAASSSKATLQLKHEKKEIIVIRNGKLVWTFIPAQQAYTETTAENTREQEPSGSKDISGVDLLRNYEILVAARYQSLAPYASTAKLERSEKLKVGGDKKDCYVLMIQTPQGSHELWIDKAQFVIWKCVDTSPTPSEGISLQSKVTVTAKEIVLNSNLEDSAFVFTPPGQAKKVDSLKLSGKNPF